MEKKIELELRAEISTQNKELFQNRLKDVGVLHSHTKRLSVMYFGKMGKKNFDIRVRVTNGECEVVVKLGSFGAHDRTEIVQKINPEEFLGMVKIFAQFDFMIEVGEREIFNYMLPDDIIVSLVSAGPISYIELEKMSSKAEVEKNNKLLNQWAKKLELQLLKSEEEFDSLCKRLAEKVDWPFHGTNKEYIKLKTLFNHNLNKKRKSG